jgi:hypothetical protein
LNNANILIVSVILSRFLEIKNPHLAFSGDWKFLSLQNYGFGVLWTATPTQEKTRFSLIAPAEM